MSISILAAGVEEKRYFEWFRCRTVKKIPGAFVSPFWDTLLFQASLTEPAVLHAILTLSSVHKREILSDDSQSRSDDVLDEHEQFMLQHYTKAISHLRPHFSNKDRSSVRIALITCVVFICLEFLRGHFKTAQTHLQNGLKVLREMRSPSSLNDNGLLFLKPSRESIDDWIGEVFCRLHFQVVLFEQGYQNPCLIVQDYCGPEPPIPIYHSFNEAWKQMERILNKIFYLAKEARQQRVSECLSLGHTAALLKQQQHIQAELIQWLDTYEASKKDLHHQDPRGLGFRLLYTYHSMANIMAGACLRSDDESVFDCYTSQFISLIEQLVNLWKIGSLGDEFLAPPGHCLNMSRSLVNIGWIPPLYYAALKCRVHRVRLQAIRLLESTSHREGIWDAKIAACVARKVMEMEERNFYRDVEKADDFLLSSSPGLRDLSLPILPQSYRIHEVKVVLPDGPMDSVLIFCRQNMTSGDWKIISKEYHTLSQCWIDGPTGEDAESAPLVRLPYF